MTIGANAVITKNIPQDVVVAGIPAKIIKYKKDMKNVHIIEKLYLY